MYGEKATHVPVGRILYCHRDHHKKSLRLILSSNWLPPSTVDVGVGDVHSL